MRKGLFLCSLVCCLLLGFTAPCLTLDGTAEPIVQRSDISIYINGTAQPDVTGVLVGSRTLVPLRFISENMGAQVAWEEQTQTATVSEGGVIHSVTIGKNQAQRQKDGAVETIPLDVGPMLLNDRTYVPVRYIAEGLGRLVDWSTARDAVLICDAQYLVFDGKAVRFTEGMASVKQAYGEPEAAFDSCKGFTWYVYKQNTPELTLFGEKNGAITEFFTISDTISLNEAAMVSVDNLETTRSMPLVECYKDEISGRNGGLYFSTQGSGNWEYDLSRSGEEIAAAESHLAFLVTNGLRAKYGITQPLLWDAAAAEASRKHCADMREHDYFDHTGLDGSKPSERYLNEAGAIPWQKIGENLALNKNAFSACFAWLNSPPHRECMLDDSYQWLGVGADYTKRKQRSNYYGQIYVLK